MKVFYFCTFNEKLENWKALLKRVQVVRISEMYEESNDEGWRFRVTLQIESFWTDLITALLRGHTGGRKVCHSFLHFRSSQGQLTAFWSGKQISYSFSIGEIKPHYSKHRPDRSTLLITGLLFDTQKPIKSQSKTQVMITKAYGAWAEVVLVQKIMWFVLAMLCQV